MIGTVLTSIIAMLPFTVGVVAFILGGRRASASVAVTWENLDRGLDPEPDPDPPIPTERRVTWGVFTRT